jgi:signal transduction histidine kinase
LRKLVTRRRTPPQEPSPGANNNSDFRAFASSAVHELRTPLTALSGEVELALRHPRSAGEYREALERIAASVGELTALTEDLAVLSAEPDPDSTKRTEAILLGRLMADAAGSCADSAIAFESPPPEVEVLGSTEGITRALSLLLRHAVKHRRPDSRVRLRLVGEGPDDGGIWLRIDAVPDGFRAGAWICLATQATSNVEPAPGEVRLRVASRLLADDGGSAAATADAQREAVLVRLRRAPRRRA